MTHPDSCLCQGCRARWNAEDLKPDDEIDKESIAWRKKCAYRHAWPKRRELTINKFEVDGKLQHITYSELFRRWYGESLEDYHRRLAAYTLGSQ